ncbi:MAG: IS5 family transposase [Magnetococcales bacterium]|nr:IS5 family transposase [Magnetococcales bacterium]
MKPPKTKIEPQGSLFHTRLEIICDSSHPLVKLAHHVDWAGLEARFEPLYAAKGRPGIRIRLMVGLTMLQSMHGLSEDEVVNRWPENPYWQYLCGETFFRHEKPIHRADLSRWRKRIGEEGLETLLAETIKLGLQTKTIKPESLKRVTVDTTVQPKNIAHPTDAKLLNRSRVRLVRLAARFGVALRQSYQRLGPQALPAAGRYAHARQMVRMRREVKRLRTFLGRVVRDIDRKMPTDPGQAASLREELALARRLLTQKRSDKNKLYSLHESHVVCIAKGKAHKPYEFGNKVSVAVTNQECFVVGMKSLPGNPYDGHTLGHALEQVERLSGQKPERCYVDKGYKGHGVTATQVFISGQRRGITPTIRKELRRRNGVVPVIGHQKREGRLDRNFLRGVFGDQANALMAGIGFNLRAILRKLRLLFALLLAMLGLWTGSKTITRELHHAWNCPREVLLPALA